MTYKIIGIISIIRIIQNKEKINLFTFHVKTVNTSSRTRTRVDKLLRAELTARPNT